MIVLQNILDLVLYNSYNLMRDMISTYREMESAKVLIFIIKGT